MQGQRTQLRERLVSYCVLEVLIAQQVQCKIYSRQDEDKELKGQDSRRVLFLPEQSAKDPLTGTVY